MNKKIKILYLTTTSKLSGTEKMLCELSRRINKRKYEIMVCTIVDDLSEQLLEILRREGIKTVCLNLDKKWKLWKIFRLFKVIHDFKPDILQSFLFFDNIMSRFFGKLFNVPIIISGQRNVEVYWSSFRNFIDKTTISLTDYIVSNSYAGKKILIERKKVSKEKIRVIHNGVNTENFNNLRKINLLDLINKDVSSISVLGFVGRLIDQKGLNYLIRAIAKLKDENLSCLIIGEGKEKEKFKKIAKNLKIENLIFFLGRRNSAWRYMKNFDILILPSLGEGMPNVILEAMIQEVPVIATNVGGIPEIIVDGENGFLVEPRDIRGLYDKIKYVLNLSEEKRKKIGKNAKKIVEEKFSIKRMVKEYENLYREIINEKIKRI
jgi:glycosyltransferase involved in cell wall biosynthesis